MAECGDESRRATLGEVVGTGEFRALWIAHAQSRLGDQLARVALTVLVFDRTESAALTGLTYALTLLPPLSELRCCPASPTGIHGAR